MKKILSLALVLVMVLSVAALVGCSGDKEPVGNDAATLKFGLGVVSNYGEAKDADGETNGAGEFNTTAVAVLLDAEGKIAAIDLDTAQIKTAWTSEGKVVAAEDLRTKYEKGADYGMAKAPVEQMDKNGDGKILEWNEQADAFIATAKGKTLAEVKAFMTEDGYTQGDLATAGCTIHVTDFVAALEKAVNSAVDSKATVENKLSVALVSDNEHSSKDATAEAAGLSQVDTTIAAVVTDAEGKVVVAKTDCVQGKMPFDVAGKSTLDATAEVKTKLELGADYGMAKAPVEQMDKNGDGKILEWNEQAAAFDAALVGKTATEFAGLATDGYATGDLATAGCTMAISDMIAAATAATK
ncbi:MAG: hypothetical protein E7556_05190 [Ruminococcaceae bacterium]|nr:hypothetical protein [Oscillospiraceae bacterium]